MKIARLQIKTLANNLKSPQGTVGSLLYSQQDLLTKLSKTMDRKRHQFHS